MNRIDYIRQASIAELKKGFRHLASINRFDCLFCSYHTEQGVIYQISPNVFYDAEKAMYHHISRIHESPLQTLLQLDKRWTGLTELQTRLSNISPQETVIRKSWILSVPAAYRLFATIGFCCGKNLNKPKYYLQSVNS